MIEICPDCGRELDTESQYYDYCHIVPGGGWSDICLPPPTPEEIEYWRPLIEDCVKEMSKRLSKAIDEVIKNAHF